MDGHCENDGIQLSSRHSRVTIDEDSPLADKAKFQAIKGVRDILPPESALWNRVEQTAREVFGTFGFAEIRLADF